MKISEKNIIEDTKILQGHNIINNCWKNKKILMDLINLDDLYFEHFNKYLDINYLSKYYNNFWLNFYEKFLDIYNKYSEKYFKLIDNLLKIFENMDFNYYIADKEIYFNENEAKELIMDFFNYMGNDKLNIVKALFQENRIGLYPLEDIDGYCVLLNTNLKPYIVLGNDVNKYSLTVIRNLAHEFGHAIEGMINQNRYSEFFTVNNLPFREVTSEFYEYEFLKYLEKNHMFERQTSNLLGYYLDSFYHFLLEAKEVLKNEIILAGETYYLANNSISFNKEGMIRYFIKKDDPNNEICKFSFDFYESLMYGFGSYLAIIFDKLKMEDVELFKRNFNDFITLRTLMSYEDIFHLLNISEEKLINGDLIKYNLKNDYDIYKKILKKN